MKIKIYYLAIAILGVLIINAKSFAQGCVAVRNMSSCSMIFDSTSNKSWQLSLNYRYFKSFRHFTGSEEDKERVEENTNVINHDNSVILGINYTINQRWSVSVGVPVVYIDRSSRPRDAAGQRVPERHYTTSKGLGDIRLMGYYAIVPNNPTGSLLAGVGVKLPTGNYKYEDDAYVNGTYSTRPVDQSIQPGDGGLGVIVEVDYLREISRNVYVYANGSYLFNPKNTNGTKTNRGNPFEAEMSVPDQLFVRAGARYMIKQFQLGIGGRVEGIPVHDIIGKTDGFRRPGYIVSLEPSALVHVGKHVVGVNVPIALYRNRTKSVADQRLQDQNNDGKDVHGDAAFADWLLSVTYAFRFSR
jgi:hypothetical protein